jgi:hypothetical protein
LRSLRFLFAFPAIPVPDDPRSFPSANSSFRPTALPTRVKLEFFPKLLARAEGGEESFSKLTFLNGFRENFLLKIAQSVLYLTKARILESP